MSPLLAALAPDSSLVAILYIVSFSLFIFGIKLGTHPTSARRGNGVAAIGMAIAVVTTLCLEGIGNWGIIIVGILVGTIVGAVASKRVKMTEMPQMVALYNGLGGGAIIPTAQTILFARYPKEQHGLARTPPPRARRADGADRRAAPLDRARRRPRRRP